MAKAEKQKLKLLYLLDLLQDQSNADHPISAQEIIAHLEQRYIL